MHGTTFSEKIIHKIERGEEGAYWRVIGKK